ncbi:MAG: radical SAM protein [Phycisphaerae bacterium]|nr:radical SAM protein [Phycisphaerae bacterium]
MRVYEIFKSIQGESTYAGLPMAFVRLAGCNLSCRYCDTRKARDKSAGRDMTVDEILSSIAPLPYVEITGGEPLLQRGEVELLAAALTDAGKTVLLETSGTHPIAGLDDRIVKIVDVKCLGSGMSEHVCWENLANLGPKDELKFVLTGREDYEWARQVLRERDLLPGPHPIIFLPVWGLFEPAVLAEWILADALPVRLQVQLHKILRLP